MLRAIFSILAKLKHNLKQHKFDKSLLHADMWIFADLVTYVKLFVEIRYL